MYVRARGGGGRGRGEEPGADAVGGPRRRRVNTEAPRRFTTPRHLGRCLTYPRLSGTQAIFTAGRVTTTRATSARRRDALRGGEHTALARATETSFAIANTFTNTGRNHFLLVVQGILRAGKHIYRGWCHAWNTKVYNLPNFSSQIIFSGVVFVDQSNLNIV